MPKMLECARNVISSVLVHQWRAVSSRATPPAVFYTQGQKHAGAEHSREYFYFLDHQGQLFLHDTKIKNFTSCYKEPKFLEFFFRNLRESNKSVVDNPYSSAFPFVSHCGREVNYVACDDLPFVVTKLNTHSDTLELNNITASAHWLYQFDPTHLFENRASGRLYYLLEGKQPAESKQTFYKRLPAQLALVRSDLAIFLMEKSSTLLDDGQLTFEYKSRTYTLNNPSIEARCNHLLSKYSQYPSSS